MANIPKTMKAAILTELRSPLIVTEIELPRKLQVGQVLVKIHFTGICGSQLGEIEGVKGEDKFLPHLLGHEASGTVIAIGPGVKKVKPNNVVVLHWRKGTGIESDPPVYSREGRRINAGLVTTFNEYGIVSENRVTPIPNSSDLKIASLFGCAVTTGFGVVENNAKVRIGESVIVFGAGGIGLNVIQAASLVSAYPIVAIDIYDNRLELAKKMGATHSINSKTEEVFSEIQKIFGNSGVDVFVDNTGQPEIIELGYKVTKPQGRITLVGVPHKGKNISIYSLPLHFGKKISGSHGGDAIPQIDIPRYQQLYSAGRLALNELLTDFYSLEQINIAISNMRNGSISGRCLIKMFE